MKNKWKKISRRETFSSSLAFVAGGLATGENISAFGEQSSSLVEPTVVIPASNYIARNSFQARKAAAFPDGTVVRMAGYDYIVDSNQTDVNSATNDLKVNGLIPHGAVYPEHFGAIADGKKDDAMALNACFDYVKKQGRQREVFLRGRTYAVGSPIGIETGISLNGAGRQGTEIRALKGITGAMIRAANQSRSKVYYRFGMNKIWINGNGRAAVGIELHNLRDGFFQEVHTSGCLDSGWKINGSSYYNNWIACVDSSPGTGWSITVVNADGANENHWYSCRKNIGTDGWMFCATAGNFNSLKLINCAVESHSGKAVHLSTTGSYLLWNTIIEGLRVDSILQGADSIVIETSGVQFTSLRNIYIQSAKKVVNNGTGTVFSGFPFEKPFNETITLPPILANSQHVQTVRLKGAKPGKWVVDVTPYGKDGIPNALSFEARITSENEFNLFVHNSSRTTQNPVKLDFSGIARRII